VAEKAACIRGRAVLLGLALIPPNFYWIVNLEVNRYSFATYAAPFYNVIFTLFLLTLLNQVVRRWRPALALNRAELLTIYAMLSIASALNSHNCMQILLGIMWHGFYFALPRTPGRISSCRICPPGLRSPTVPCSRATTPGIAPSISQP